MKWDAKNKSIPEIEVTHFGFTKFIATKNNINM